MDSARSKVCLIEVQFFSRTGLSFFLLVGFVDDILWVELSGRLMIVVGGRVLWLDSMRGGALLVVFESGALLLVGAVGGEVLESLLVFLDRVWIGICSLGDGGLALVLIVAVWA
jgi:hypothetical protein